MCVWKMEMGRKLAQTFLVVSGGGEGFHGNEEGLEEGTTEMRPWSRKDISLKGICSFYDSIYVCVKCMYVYA